MLDDLADALHARHVRQRRRSEVRRTTGAQQVQRRQRYGEDPDDRLAVADRLVPLLDEGTAAVLVEDGRTYWTGHVAMSG